MIAEVATTVRVRLMLLEPCPLLTVKVTVFGPAAEKAWLGFRVVEVVPSPKFHCQEVGLPVEVSVNCAAWFIKGVAGLKENDALSAAEG
jgi:hypothetical protein